MDKKISLIIYTVLIVSFFTLTASAKIGLEFRGGLALINPEEYNTGLLYVNPVKNNFGFANAFSRLYGVDPVSGIGNPGYNSITNTTVGSYLSQLFDGGANISIFFGDSFAIKLRGDVLVCNYDDIIQIDGIDCLYSNTSLTTAYIGAGLAYYFNLSPNLAFYLSGDGGMFINPDKYSWYQVGSMDTTEAKNKLNDVNLPQGAYSVDFKDSFYGGHGEAGFQLLLSEAVGISFYGGYRYGVMPATFPNNGRVDLTGVDASGNTHLTVSRNGVFTAKTLDISGAYFGGGLVFYLGADKLPASGAKAAAAATGATSKYEQYGNYYFKQKNYKYALSYYNGAYKLSPNPKLLKQIAYCYYYMKDQNKALEYLQKYLATNPDDPAILNWVKTLQH